MIKLKRKYEFNGDEWDLREALDATLDEDGSDYYRTVGELEAMDRKRRNAQGMLALLIERLSARGALTNEDIEALLGDSFEVVGK